jgi:hypothetical protein
MAEYDSSRKHVAVTPRIKLVVPSARTISRPTERKVFEADAEFGTFRRSCWRTCSRSQCADPEHGIAGDLDPATKMKFVLNHEYEQLTRPAGSR